MCDCDLSSVVRTWRLPCLEPVSVSIAVKQKPAGPYRRRRSHSTHMTDAIAMRPNGMPIPAPTGTHDDFDWQSLASESLIPRYSLEMRPLVGSCLALTQMVRRMSISFRLWLRRNIVNPFYCTQFP